MAEATKTRIKRDLGEFFRDPPPNIYIVPNDDNIYECAALIIGPDGTPYEKGFFFFYVKFPSDYPVRPPHVLLRTTGNGRVRFNPNLYACGKVCLSILGTWSGPAWSPAQTLRTVLVSIQSLMNEKPYFNEPGYERCEHLPEYQQASNNYNDNILFHTLQVAVLDMVENRNGDSRCLPAALREVMEGKFKEYIPYYEKVIKEKMEAKASSSSSASEQTNKGDGNEKTLAADENSPKTEVEGNGDSEPAGASGDTSNTLSSQGQKMKEKLKSLIFPPPFDGTGDEDEEEDMLLMQQVLAQEEDDEDDDASDDDSDMDNFGEPPAKKSPTSEQTKPSSSMGEPSSKSSSSSTPMEVVTASSKHDPPLAAATSVIVKNTSVKTSKSSNTSQSSISGIAGSSSEGSSSASSTVGISVATYPSAAHFSFAANPTPGGFSSKPFLMAMAQAKSSTKKLAKANAALKKSLSASKYFSAMNFSPYDFSGFGTAQARRVYNYSELYERLKTLKRKYGLIPETIGAPPSSCSSSSISSASSSPVSDPQANHVTSPPETQGSSVVVKTPSCSSSVPTSSPPPATNGPKPSTAAAAASSLYAQVSGTYIGGCAPPVSESRRNEKEDEEADAFLELLDGDSDEVLSEYSEETSDEENDAGTTGKE